MNDPHTMSVLLGGLLVESECCMQSMHPSSSRHQKDLFLYIPQIPNILKTCTLSKKVVTVVEAEYIQHLQHTMPCSKSI